MFEAARTQYDSQLREIRERGSVTSRSASSPARRMRASISPPGKLRPESVRE